MKPRLVLCYSVLEKTTDNYFKIEITPYAGIRYIGFSLQSDTFDAISLIDVKPNWFEPLLVLFVQYLINDLNLKCKLTMAAQAAKTHR